MNKRQRKKSVMRNVSKLYDMVFERERFRRDVAIVCGRGPRGKRILTTVMIEIGVFEFSPYEGMEISLEGYIADCKAIQERSS